MSQTIKLKIDINACNDTKVSIQPEISVEACDKIQETVGPGQIIKLNVQPGPKIRFLFINANQYKKLSYSLDKQDGTEGNSIPFETAQMFMGEGISTALQSPVTQLWLKNEGDEDANIDILVGRDAIVPPAPAPAPAPAPSP